MDDTEVIQRLRNASDEAVGALDPAQVRQRSRVIVRRRRALRSAGAALALAGVAVAGGIAGRQSAPTVVVTASPVPPSTADTGLGLPSSSADANQQIIDSLPVVPRTRFSAYSQADGPSGESSLVSYVTFRATDDGFSAATALDAFRGLEGWDFYDERAFATRTSLRLTRGRALLEVDAYPGHGYTVVVASRDAAALLESTR